MPERLPVAKTYKLFINGRFPRSESGRSMCIEDRRGRVHAHVSHASRKDLRDSVEAARAAQPGWAAAPAYLRGQILYRMAEMMEGKQAELAAALRVTSEATAAEVRREVAAAIDRVVVFAGWADKYAQVLGCHNPVAGPYYNFTVPDPSGVVGLVPPDEPALLGLVTLMMPPLCAGNALVIVAHRAHPLPAALLGEVCATADVPPGIVNILTTDRDELLHHLADHREIIAIAAADLGEDAEQTLRLGAADNVKRVHLDRFGGGDAWLDPTRCESPWTIEPYVEMKTIWHPNR